MLVVRKFLLLLLSFFPAFAVIPERSISYLPLSNGRCYAVYDLNKAAITQFQPSLVSVYAKRYYVDNLFSKANFYLDVNQSQISLSAIPVKHSGYINGTGIARIEHQLEHLRVIEYNWCPMILDFPVLIMMVFIPDAARMNLGKEHIQFELYSPAKSLEPVKILTRDADGIWAAVIFIHKEAIDSATLAELRKERTLSCPAAAE